MLPGKEEVELRALQHCAESMELLPALGFVLLHTLLVSTQEAAGAGIQDECHKALVLNISTGNQRCDFRVFQDPKSLDVRAGENVTLRCTFENHSTARTRVTWFWGAAGDITLQSHHPFYKGRIQTSNLEQHKHGEATLMLSALQEQDSGSYHCCVQRNDEQIGVGEGTMLSVTQMNQSHTAESECSMNPTGDRSTEIIMYRAGVALGAMAFLAMTVLLLQRYKETTTKTQHQPAKRHRQAGGETSDVLQYAEINLTPGKPVEYASVQTHPGECTEYASVQIHPL